MRKLPPRQKTGVRPHDWGHKSPENDEQFEGWRCTWKCSVCQTIIQGSVFNSLEYTVEKAIETRKEGYNPYVEDCDEALVKNILQR